MICRNKGNNNAIGLLNIFGLGLGQRTVKEEARPARVAGAGQENIEIMHEPKPIQTAVTLWGQGRRAMEHHRDSQTQALERSYVIKVSMSYLVDHPSFIYLVSLCTDHRSPR